MPIITKPSPLEKNATGVFSLNKTALALHPTVVASAHFSSPNVWEKVIVKYKSDTLGQFESIEFDATVASPEGQFFVSATAEDIFEVEKITIIDKDGAILLIPRASLTVAEFDIDFGAPIFAGTYVDWTEDANYNTAQLDGGLTSNIANYNDTSLASMNYATQDVLQGTGKVLTYKIKGSDLWLGGYAFIGFGLSNTFWGFYKNNPTAGNYLSLLYGNSVIGTYTGIVNNSTIVTLEIKTKSTAFEFWIDGIKVGESTAITSSTLKPTARIYLGMEITEAYFE
jgi:hypothetical protein